MDRLSALVVLATLACEQRQEAPPPSPRVNAVRAGVQKEATAEEFCDKRYSAADAPSFAFPTLAGAAPTTSGWRWVNVWATWCKPCVEEIPRIVGWRPRLGNLPLVLVSVDENDQVVADFRKAHPDIPEGIRLADPAALPAWLKTLGLDEAAPIPIHIFVDPQGKTRCVRAGGVGEPDLAAVEKVVTN